MGTFTVISSDAVDELQLDAGVLLDTFDPASPTTPASSAIIATTTGGINIVCEPEYEDFGEDIDNVPNNTKDFKRITGWNCSMSFSSLKFNDGNTKLALGAADVTTVAAGTNPATNAYKKIQPRADVKSTDYADLWWVGDKADGGAYAVKLKNAISTGGLNIQTTKNAKGTNQITLTGHVAISALDTVPMEFYSISPAASASTGT